MDIQKLIAAKEAQRKNQSYISFSEAELQSITEDQIQHVMDYFHGYTMMQLPALEIDFFNWLRENDPAIWDDLWGDNEDMYLVSIDLLRHLCGVDGIFPICDLMDEPNYWFCDRHIKPQGREALLDIELKRQSGAKLKVAERFLLEVDAGSTDIWHFAYRFKLTPDRVRKAVDELEQQGLLVHLPDRADLVKYIEF